MKIDVKGMPLYNASGDIDPSSAGFKYLIDTLTFIRAQVIEQVFYEVNIADYLPMDVGVGAWSEEIVQNIEFYNGGGFFEGDIDTGSGNGRIANVDAALGRVRMPTRTWAKSASWTVIEIAKAASANNWDVVEGKLKSLKKNWDLGIQEVAFLGHPQLSDMTGLLNDGDVSINTTLITEPVSGMDASEFQAFVRGLLRAYYANSNSTRMPDTFVMPTDDYLGLGDAASATYPNISKLEYLLNALRRMTGNPSFEILPLAYAQDDFNADNGINKNRYVLYRRDPETLSMSIPVDFTMLNADTSNQFQWMQPAYGQYSGVLVNRKREVLYFDETAPST
jgi:hypothetical protein